MKKLVLLLSCSICIYATAQTTVNISASDYDNMKMNHQLDATKQYVFSDALVKSNQPAVKYHGANRSPSSICSCMIPLDASFSVAPICQGGCYPPSYRNDDGSTAAMALPFSFNFYGTTYTSVYINLNGSISFVSSESVYSGVNFPTSGFTMLAPFWADIDTRNVGSGLVYYKITPTAMIIKWENVGYFSEHIDKVNTFQVILTNGTDTLLPAGDNVSFCYGDMQWTTGDASAGVGGFGGYAATVGVNKGDGVNYFQIGRFGQAGAAFDGPYGATDGIDWLDNQGMYFNIAAGGVNIPPVIIDNNICDTIDVYTGDTTHTMLIDSVQFKIGICSPESSQTTTTTLTSSMPSKFSYVQTSSLGWYNEYICKFNVTSIPEGLYYIYINSVDNGTPVGVSNKTIVIRSHYDASLATTVGIKETNINNTISIYPNPTESSITVKHNFSSSSNPLLSITNVLGENIMNIVLKNTEQTIDISRLEKGIYFATIISKEGKSQTIKVVKK